MKYLLQKRTWEGTGEVIFHSKSVRISMHIDEVALRSLIMPVILVGPLEEESDPVADEEPDLMRLTAGMHIMVAHPQDPTGETPLIGGSRAAGSTSSRGRGLLEIEEEVFAAVKALNDIDGVRIQSRGKSAVAPIVDPKFGYVVTRDYLWQIETTATRFYHPAHKFACTGGAGSIVCTWMLPPDRYDRYRVRLVYKAGAVAPVSLTDGTEVTLAGPLVTTHTITLAAGTYSLSLFASYDETNAPLSADQRTSDPVSKTSIVVT
jgi:hypothetical protein